MFDVRDFGAVGDGKADDTEAFQAALDAARGGGTVYVPGGSYRLTTALVIRSRTRIVAYDGYMFRDGDHRMLQNFADADVFARYDGNSHITVQGGIWDARGQHAPDGVIANVIGFVHARDITVQDVVVRNVAGYHGLEFNSVARGRAVNCRFEGYRRNGASFAREAIQIDIARSGSADIGEFDGTYAKDIVIDGCYAGPARDGSGLGGFGALVGSHTSVAEGHYEGIRVVNNRCDGSVLYGIRAEAWRDPVITGNQINDTAGTAVYVHDGVRGVISDNTVRGPGSNGINVTNQSGVLISGNTVDTPTGDSGSYCVYLNHCRDSRVQGNHLLGGPTAGLKLAVGCNHTIVQANTIRQGSGSRTAVIGDAGEDTTNTVILNDLTGYGTNPQVIDVQSGIVRTTLPEDQHLGSNIG